MCNNNSVATDSTGRSSTSSFQRVITRPKFRSYATNFPYTIPSTNPTIYRNFGQQQQHNYALNPNPSFLGQRRYVRRYPTTSYSTNQHVFGGLNERSTLQFEDDILCNEDGYIQFEG
uniref:Uncharacterized protein n=1 Tax=Panagrolaimus davidi TaxID=227884 RepID=A0A914QNY9_9BILA